MEFWIARDDYGLWLFDSKPIKRNRNNDKYYIWENNRYSIDHKLFSEITFENSPQKVELKLINGEKGLIVPNLQTSNPALKCNTRCRNFNY